MDEMYATGRFPAGSFSLVLPRETAKDITGKLRDLRQLAKTARDTPTLLAWKDLVIAGGITPRPKVDDEFPEPAGFSKCKIIYKPVLEPLLEHFRKAAKNLEAVQGRDLDSVETDKATLNRFRTNENAIKKLATERAAIDTEIKNLNNPYTHNYRWAALPENSGIVDLDASVVSAINTVRSKIMLMPSYSEYAIELDGIPVEALTHSDVCYVQAAHWVAIEMYFSSALWQRTWSDQKNMAIQQTDESVIRNFFATRLSYDNSKKRFFLRNSVETRMSRVILSPEQDFYLRTRGGARTLY
jgi:hypothetical protein